MEPVAVIQIALMPNGEIQAQVKGMTLDRFPRMICDGVALIQPKLIAQEKAQAGPKIQVPSPSLVPRLVNGHQ